MVTIERIKYRIAAEPFVPGDAAITIEIIQQEDLLHGMGERRSSLQFSQTVSKLLLQGFNRLAEALDAFTQLVGGHPILSHQRIKTLPIHMDLSFSSRSFGSIQLATERTVNLTQLIQEFR